MEIKEFIENFADQFDDTDISEIKPDEYGVQLTFDELKHAITVQNLFDIVEKKQNNG